VEEEENVGQVKSGAFLFITKHDDFDDNHLPTVYQKNELSFPFFFVT